MNARAILAFLALADVVAAQPPQAEPRKTTAHHFQAKGDWGVTAEWKPQVTSGSAETAIVHSLADVQQISLWFRKDNEAVENLTIRLELQDGNKGDHAREAAKFFWTPRYKWEAEKYSERTDKTPFAKDWGAKRFSLIVEPADVLSGREVVAVGARPLSSAYRAYNHNRVVTHPETMQPFLDLMDEIANSGKGKVYWLIEPGLKEQPERVVLAWQEDGTPWGRVKMASPAWSESFDKVEVFEPRGETPPVVRQSGRTGLVQLPPGSWQILERCSKDTKLVAIGKEGIVLQTTRKGESVYEVFVLNKTTPEGEKYAPAIVTRGLGNGEPVPEWTERFGVTNSQYSQNQGRHLVGLSVCSPEVWKKARSSDTQPARHLVPLFADPELWACPPVK